MKKILISSVSDVDPYTINEKKDDNGDLKTIYNDGSILQTIRFFKKNGSQNEINEIYLFLTLEMAIKEYRRNGILLKTIKEISGLTDEKIHFFPENIYENVKKILDEKKNKNEFEDYEKNSTGVKEENDFAVNKKIKGDIEKEPEILKVTKNFVANRFGSLYSELSIVLEKIKENEKKENKTKDYEIIYNISSGTSAMQSDLCLTALTSNEKSVIVQVDTPAKASNRGNNSQTKDLLICTPKEFESQIKELNESSNRAHEEKLENVKKLLLKNSLEDLFEKHDFAGVYEAIKNNKEILDEKNILIYAKNLYYRYIGNAEKAKENIDKDMENFLYPCKKMKCDDANILERINILKVKAERREVNDWLLHAETTIESLYKYLLTKATGFRIEDVTNTKGQITIKLPKDYKQNKEKYENELGIQNYKKNSVTQNRTDRNNNTIVYGDKIDYYVWKNKNMLTKLETLNNKKLLNNKKIKGVLNNHKELIKTLVDSNGNYVNAIILKNLLKAYWKFYNGKKKYAYFKNDIEKLDQIRGLRNDAAHNGRFVTMNDINEIVDSNNKICQNKNDYDKNDYEPLLKITQIIQKIHKKLVIDENSEKNTEIENKKYYESVYESNYDDAIEIYNKIQNKIMNLLKEEINKNN